MADTFFGDLEGDFFLEEINMEEFEDAIPAKKRRFDSVNDQDVEAMMKSAENENTKKSSNWVVRLLETFVREAGLLPESTPFDFASIGEDPTMMANILTKFFTTAKRADGGDYEPNSIRGIMGGIDRYLAANRKPKVFHDSTNPQYVYVQEVAKSKMKKLKSMGKGNLPNRAAPLTDEEIEKLWTSGQLGRQTPRTLINTMWWYNSLHFGMRAITEHKQMCWGDIEVKTGSNHRRFLEFNERATKTRTGSSKNDANQNQKAYENPTNPERCPVELYLKYAALRPKEACTPQSPFYLACSTLPGTPKPGLKWYKNCPLGINTIGKLMKKMAAAADLTGKNISGTTARKTLLQKLNDSGLPPTHIMEKSGHQNMQSVNNYSKMNDAQQMQVSRILNSTRTCTVTSNTVSDVTEQEITQISRGAPSSSTQPSVEFHAPIHGGVFNFTFTMPQ